MAVSFRSASTGINTTASANSTDTEPSGSVFGDALIALCVFASGSSTAANAAHPSLWSLLASVTQGAFKANLAWISRGGSAPSLIWATAGATIYREIRILCLTGAAALTLDSQSLSGSIGAASGHAADPPATTAAASSSLAVACGVNWGGPSSPGPVTAPTGYTLRSNGTFAAGYDGQLATKALVASGSENPGTFGAFTGNGSSFDFWDGFTVTFTDVGASAGPDWIPRRGSFGQDARLRRRNRIFVPSMNDIRICEQSKRAA